jgi:hypothetical protein
MRTSLSLVAASIVLLSSFAVRHSSFAQGAVPAFPGAQGFNTHLCTHGRGGKVLVVTSLEDNSKGQPQPGTFRWACAQEGPRVIVFAVGGVLALTKEVTVAPDVYIAGQTAPGDGICLTQAGLKLGSNTLIRHVRFRPGDQMPGAALTKRDAFNAQGDNIILDHYSIAWTTDECFRVNGGENVTLSWCFMGEGLHITQRAEMHNYGPALEPNFETGGMSKNITLHHCLMSGFAARSPLIGNGDREVHLLFANNVLYNYGGAKYPPIHTYAPKQAGPKAGAAFGRVDVIANYFKEGPVTPAGSPVVLVHGLYPNGGIYLEGNLAAALPETGDDWAKLMADANDPAVLARRAKAAQHTISGIAFTDAATAYERVLQHAGATYPRRDSVDERFARDARSGTAFRGTGGGKEGGGFGAYHDYIFADPATTLKRHTEGPKAPHKNLGMKLEDIDPVPGGKEYFASFKGGPAPQDSDADGIPDAWETAHGLDAMKPDSAKLMPSGYSAIEEYLESLATPAR